MHIILLCDPTTYALLNLWLTLTPDSIFVNFLQNWAAFEPPKTTVKRMLLQEQQKTAMNQQTVLSERVRSTVNTPEQSLLRLKDHASPVVSSNKGELRFTVECISLNLILIDIFVFHFLFFAASLV